MDYIFLGFIMIIAGFVDSIAGGGGIIRLPAYLAFGLNPALILGTNKMGSVMATFVAAYKLRDKITVSKKLMKFLGMLAFVCSVVGAALSRLVDAGYLKFLILIIAPLMAYFIISNKNLGRVQTRRAIGIKKSNGAAKQITVFCSVYDGFLGPGTGTMLAVFLTKYAGFTLLQSTAMAKILNFCSNLFAMLFFLYIGAADIPLGLAMGCCGILGSFLGVYFGKKYGALIIRPMLIFVCALIFLKFIFDYSR
jgi:uncharacterized membrane protein YfcA